MKKLLIGVVAFTVMFCVFGCEQEPPGGWTGDLEVRIGRLTTEIEALETTIADLQEQIDSLEESLTDVMDSYNTLATKFEDHMNQYHGEKAKIPKVTPPKKRIK